MCKAHYRSSTCTARAAGGATGGGSGAGGFGDVVEHAADARPAARYGTVACVCVLTGMFRAHAKHFCDTITRETRVLFTSTLTAAALPPAAMLGTS